MGLDMTYQAVPDDSRLFELAALGPDHGEALQFINGYLSDAGPDQSGDCVSALYREEARRLRAAHPGIERRSYNLQRAWDKLHFMLSAPRRKGDSEERSWWKTVPWAEDYGTQAIRGERDAHEFARATQGAPIRYVSATTAAAIYAWMNPITRQDLQSVYNPTAMAAAAVYKQTADHEEFEWLWRHFEGFREFYRGITRHGEGMLAILD